MSEVKGISTITNRAGTGAVDFSNGVNISGSDSGLSAFKHTEGSTEPSSPSNGDTWWDTENEIYQIYVNDTWTTYIGASTVAHYGDRGLTAGGFDSTYRNHIEYYDITTASNSSDFGDLTRTKGSFSAVSDATYGVFGAGLSTFEVIDYVTISTAGNATDFGDAGAGRSASASDASRGCFAGGYDGTATTAAIEYITIATTGNTTSFGDLTAASSSYNNGMSDNTYGVVNVVSSGMNYFTIQTTGNATSFGNLSSSRTQTTSTDDASRGLNFGGGNTDVIDYITISTPSNATDFGDLLFDTYQSSATSNGTRAVHSGGRHPTTTRSNIIQYVTIQTTGNATDFGDLVTARSMTAATSGNAS